MEKNFSSKFSGQIGEHVAVAELGRHGIIATPFSGNVPDIDILAYANKKTIPIQVKALRKGDASVNAGNYLDIEFVENNKQIIHGLNVNIDRDLIFILVSVGLNYGEDQFYIFRQGSLQDMIYKNHKSFLDRNNGIRPRAPKSLHCSYNLADLEKYRNNWGIILKELNFS